MNLYQILGIESTATQEGIKAAYRRLSMEHHPDRGGDAEKFKRVKEAYEVLSDPERRWHYDDTGETAAQDTLRQKAEQLVASTLIDLLAKSDEEQSLGSMTMWDLANTGPARIVDPIMSAASAISEVIRKNLQEQDKARKAITRLKRSLRRISRRGEGLNLVQVLLEQQVESAEVFLIKAAEEHRMFCLATEILSDYQYDRGAGERRSAAPDNLRLGA